MDVANALAEFASLLQLGAASLKEISSAYPDMSEHLQEIDGMADRLNEISRQIAEAGRRS